MPHTVTSKPAVKAPKSRPAPKPRGAAKKPLGVRVLTTATGKFRAKLALTQPEFARLLPVSVRSLASLEGGAEPTEPVARRLTELQRLTAALAEVVRAESIGPWLKAPNPAFDGLKPLEVIERGEADRLWEMVYFLRSGVPS